LGKTWQFKLKALSADRISPYVTLAAGSYDPDHDFDLSNTVDYTADFTFNLPDISSTAGITTTSSPLGFNIQIVGNG
jgi:hypothetical protein